MRRLVVVLVVVMLVAISFAIAGCGGDDTVGVNAETPADAPPPVTEEDPADVDYSAQEGAVYEPFPRDEEALPDAVATRLNAGQPMIILFVDRTEPATDEQEGIVESVKETYRGLIDVVTYDVSRYVTQDAYGEVSVNSEINKDEAAAPVARLVSEQYLDVRFTPYTVIVDREGFITWRYRGVADEKTLEREVIRATD